MAQQDSVATARAPWWRSIGPALITACVVFGPGSLLISSNVGATYGYELLWMLLLTGVLMGTFMTMAARIGVMGGATPCTLIAARLGRVAAAIIGINLCLICTAFQFSNNLAVAAAFDTLGVERFFAGGGVGEGARTFMNTGFLLAFNGLVIASIFVLRHVYNGLERIMKVMVAVILVCFVANLFVARPSLAAILGGLVPSLPEGLSLRLPARGETGIVDPMLLIASLLGTTFSVAAAFYQGNLVREKGWNIADYRRGIGDSIAGVAVLTGISAMIMITSAKVLQGSEGAKDIGVLAMQLRPLLGPATRILFSIGLFAVAMNPFVINSMIAGSILADGLGKPARLSDPWSRWFTVAVLLVGMIVAMIVLHTPVKKMDAIIFGQALTVIGNPLMAASILWLANRKDIMRDRRNSLILNIVGGFGFLVVLLIALRVLYLLVLRLS